MFLQRLAKSIAICATALAAVVVVSFPVAISAQGVPGTGGAGARSGPAEGGVAGTVDGVSTSGFTVLTSAGQKVDDKGVGSGPLTTPCGNGWTETQADALRVVGETQSTLLVRIHDAQMSDVQRGGRFS